MERNQTFYRVDILFTFLCLCPSTGNPIVSSFYITDCTLYSHKRVIMQNSSFYVTTFSYLFTYEQTFMFIPHLGYCDSFCSRKLLYLSSHTKKPLLFAVYLLALRKKVHHKWCLVKILELGDHWFFWRSIC